MLNTMLTAIYKDSDYIATSFRQEFERSMNKLSFFRSPDANFNSNLSFRHTFVTKSV